VGLVNMNGRVYDLILGRFLSADTVIQTLGSSQAINPYAYAWNDPLKYIDPSGHSLLGDIVGAIVAIVVAYFTFGIVNAYLASQYVIGASVYASAAAGFVSGFVGAMIATGSLSAALTAGLISGVTAGLFNAAGTAFSGDSGLDIGERALAHAAVGCASAAASGGNCGKGALAAAVTEGANSTVMNGNEFASWGHDGQLAPRYRGSSAALPIGFSEATSSRGSRLLRQGICSTAPLTSQTGTVRAYLQSLRYRKLFKSVTTQMMDFLRDSIPRNHFLLT